MSEPLTKLEVGVPVRHKVVINDGPYLVGVVTHKYSQACEVAWPVQQKNTIEWDKDLECLSR